MVVTMMKTTMTVTVMVMVMMVMVMVMMMIMMLGAVATAAIAFLGPPAATKHPRRCWTLWLRLVLRPKWHPKLVHRP
jgi:hypothetical protein